MVPKEGRVLREAGFTEQRRPPAPNSGRITGWCTAGPHCSGELVSVEPPLFLLLFYLGYISTSPSVSKEPISRDGKEKSFPI